MAHVLAATRLIGLIGVILFSATMQSLFLALKWRRMSEAMPYLFHRLVTRVLGFQVATKGKIHDQPPTLFVSNHVSYTDIVILGGVTPACFVSKTEVAKWPVIGWLARLQRTVFIERTRSKAALHNDTLQQRLNARQSLIIFPEGTTGDAQKILPFKSTMFAVAQREVTLNVQNGSPQPLTVQPLTVQPVTIAYTHLEGLPIGYAKRVGWFGWYGEMGLGGHAWRLMGLTGKRVEITYHTPVTIKDFEDRKDLSKYCHHISAAGLADSLGSG